MFLLEEKKNVFLLLFLLKIKEVKSKENKIIIKNKCDNIVLWKEEIVIKMVFIQAKMNMIYLSMKIKYYYEIIKNIIKQFLLL